jgi:LysR family transcriptional regulator, glycine cleavage system transcriptional activator
MNRPPRLSLDLLRAFRAAAAYLSFTRAARDQFVTQSAISHAIRTLEEQLGQPLFHRVNRALRLTHAGEALYRATDEAIALIDAATERIAGSERTLGVTTTAALASLWLVPRLPQFTRLHSGTDVRIVATNDRIDVEREHLDLAIHFVPLWDNAPDADLLVEYRQFPVCSPALARSRKTPLRTPADLARHVRLDFETVVYGRPWYDWENWSDAMKLRSIAPASTMRFSHYDQVIQAAIEGGGVAIGKWPHLARHLREGVLCVPLGPEFVARLGAFYIVFARGADATGPVESFVAWLRDEVRRDADAAPAVLNLPKPAARAVRRRGTEATRRAGPST